MRSSTFALTGLLLLGSSTPDSATAFQLSPKTSNHKNSNKPGSSPLELHVQPLGSTASEDDNHLLSFNQHEDKSERVADPAPSSPWTTRLVSWGASLSLATLLSLSSLPSSAMASGYGSLSPEQKGVAEAWRLVDNSYLDRTFQGQDWFAVRQKLVATKYKNMDDARAAIDSFVSNLGDKYTRYLSPAKYQSLVDSATGTLAGVGIELSRNKEGRVIASDVEPNSPAAKAGILPNMVFEAVDGVPFESNKDVTPDDVASLLRGPPGTKVDIVISTDSSSSKLDKIVTREPIQITSVRSYVSNLQGVGKVGVIRIKSFSSQTEQLVKDKYNELVSKKGAVAIVFDVRGNPGGLLPGGVDTASLFLPSNQPVVFVVNKSGVADKQVTYKDGIDTDTTPLVVLVDGNTASAAEVFTAALKENNHRATIVGEQTFGKGIIQTIRPLEVAGGGVAITVARYETPQHNDINKQGVPVDIKMTVECPKDDALSCLSAKAFPKK